MNTLALALDTTIQLQAVSAREMADMAEPLRLTANDICDGDATPPTGEPDPAPADVEPSPLGGVAPKFNVQLIAVDDVLVVGSRRAANEEVVTRLAQSIKGIGLQTPITVRLQGSAHELVVGLHRLMAYRQLGWRYIPAIVRDCDKAEAELWEIDENLCRAELSPAELAECTARRKALYEQLHPETVAVTRRGGPGRGKNRRQVGDGFSDRFTADTAAKTGQSERTIQRAAERGQKIASDVMADITGSQWDKGAILDLLKKLDHDEQRQALQRVQSGISRSFQDAYRFIKGDQLQRPAKPARTPAAPLSANKARDQGLPTGLASTPARQSDLAAAIRDLNVAWPPEAIEMAAAGFTEPQKSQLRQHLPDLRNKLQRLGDSIDLERATTVVDQAMCADQPSLFSSN